MAKFKAKWLLFLLLICSLAMIIHANPRDNSTPCPATNYPQKKTCCTNKRPVKDYTSPWSFLSNSVLHIKS
ncbi:MAG: hypothetical protein ABIT96_05655 [Ferruginibacter sp.]